VWILQRNPSQKAPVALLPAEISDLWIMHQWTNSEMQTKWTHMNLFRGPVSPRVSSGIFPTPPPLMLTGEVRRLPVLHENALWNFVVKDIEREFEGRKLRKITSKELNR
jgi:hypothetical protein